MPTKVLAKDIKNQAFLTTGTAPAYEVDIPRSVSYAEMDRVEILVNFHTEFNGEVTLNVSWFWAKTIEWIEKIEDDEYLSLIYDLSKDAFVVWSAWASEATGWASSQTLFVSDEIIVTDAEGWNHNTIHNLNVSQADVENGRYKVLFSQHLVSGTNWWVLERVMDSWQWNENRNSYHKWTSDPSWSWQDVNRQANSINYQVARWGAVWDMSVKVIIIDMRATGIGYEKITNNAWYDIFDSVVNGTTPVVINDSRIDTETPFNIYFESEPAGNITKTLAPGSLTIVSDDVADTMNFRIVAFNMWTDTYITSEIQTLDGAWPWVINDGRVSEDSPVNLFPLTDPSWFLTVEAGDGTLTITSSWTESNLEAKYIIFEEVPDMWAILDWAYWASWEGDTANAPSRNAVYDKIESLETQVGWGSSISVWSVVRGASVASNTQTIAHWLWRIPKKLAINYIRNNASYVEPFMWRWLYDWTTQFTLGLDSWNPARTKLRTGVVLDTRIANSGYTATVSYDGTYIYINRILAGSAQAVDLIREVE